MRRFPMKPIDIELARSLLEYAPEIGGSCLRWKRALSNRVCVGNMAGSEHNGYWSVQIHRELYKAHRLVWAIVYGEDPPCQIDHVHGHLAGNNVENLRLATRNSEDNGQNRKKHKNNASGYQGVVFHKRTKKWYGSIRVKGKLIHLGSFDTPIEAYTAYVKAKAELHTFSPKPRDE